jgi:hypothetical protein
VSVSDLRHRMSDVPGIQNLSMDLQAGRIVLSWGEGYSAAVDATASDADIEAAVRAAIRLPPISAIPDVQPSPAPANAAPAPVQPMTTPSTAGLNVKDMMERHVKTMADIHQAQLALLQASLDRQVNAVTGAVTNVATKIDGQTDEFLSMMGQFTNDLGV